MIEPNSSKAYGAKLPKPPLAMIYTIQLIILFVGVLLLRVILGWQEGATVGWNVLCGGLISWISCAWFARMAFRYSGARQIQQVARAFYLGETGKFILSASLFVIVFVTVRPLHPIALFAGYVVMTAINAGFAAKIVRRQT